MKVTTSSRSDQLATAIRRRIVSGEFGPGHRLPTFQEIESNYTVSRGVAQMAIERLKKDGFIDSASRQGLYVVHTPPHLRRYGIAFPIKHADPAWSRFDDVLVREARLLQQSATDRDFEVFAGTQDYQEGAKVVGHMRREVLNDRLAGLILSPGSFELAAQMPFSDPNLPKVYVFYQPGCGVGPIVTGDGEALIHRSLQHLVDQGCRRVAVIRMEGAHSSINAAHFKEHGLEFRPQWMQIIGRGDTAVLATLIPLLMDYPLDQRPDGIFVLDDNLVDHTTSAIITMGLRIGYDLQMVAHSNWPSRNPSVLPVRRIGYHIGNLLSRCIDVIDMQRRGETPPEVQRIPANFEDELDTI